jgi:putative transposase
MRFSYGWKKKYGGMGVAELRHLSELEQENRKLRRMVADLTLDKQMLQDVLKKSLEAGEKARDGPVSSGGLRSECEAGVQGGRDPSIDAWFQTLDEAKSRIEQWRREYNEDRPYSSLGNRTPKKFARSLEPEGTSRTKTLTLQVV